MFGKWLRTEYSRSLLKMFKTENDTLPEGKENKEIAAAVAVMASSSNSFLWTTWAQQQQQVM